MMRRSTLTEYRQHEENMGFTKISDLPTFGQTILDINNAWFYSPYDQSRKISGRDISMLVKEHSTGM